MPGNANSGNRSGPRGAPLRRRFTLSESMATLVRTIAQHRHNRSRVTAAELDAVLDDILQSHMVLLEQNERLEQQLLGQPPSEAPASLVLGLQGAQVRDVSVGKAAGRDIVETHHHGQLSLYDVDTLEMKILFAVYRRVGSLLDSQPSSKFFAETLRFSHEEMLDILRSLIDRGHLTKVRDGVDSEIFVQITVKGRKSYEWGKAHYNLN